MRITHNPTTEFSFVHFVYRVLLFKVYSLDSFRLKCSRDYGGLIHSWLFAALSRHVREIDLNVPKDDLCVPPPRWSSLDINCLFSSTTLVVLKLGGGFSLSLPDIISLESLKILHLCSVWLNRESLTKLVSSCPLLEELKLQGKLSEYIIEFNISSPVLKRLILSGLYFGYYPYYLSLNTPSLEYLEHVDEGIPDSYHLEMETLHYLGIAHLCLRLDDQQLYQYDDELTLAKSIADLVVAISNVRFLYLSESVFEALYYSERSITDFELPKSPRLIDLKIGAIAKSLFLIDFLIITPQLESLSFAIEQNKFVEMWQPPRVVPFCMQYNLKAIEIIHFTRQTDVNLAPNGKTQRSKRNP